MPYRQAYSGVRLDWRELHAKMTERRKALLNQAGMPSAATDPARGCGKAATAAIGRLKSASLCST